MEASDKPKNYGWKVLISIVILLLIVIFSVQNSTGTRIKFLMWDRETPLVFLMVFSFALGLGFALLAIWPVSRHSKRKSKLIKELQLRIEFLEEQQSKNQSAKL